MQILEGYHPHGQCRIFIGRQLEEMAAAFKPQAQVLLLSEKIVIALHGDKLATEGIKPDAQLVLPSLGDGLKSPSYLNRILHWFNAHNVTRNSYLIILGGGALCDLGGFAASVWKRGIRTILVPTTLLAQVDVSVGGKCGINFLGAKNLLGAFWFPELVWAASEFLHTLPPRQLFSGWGEVCKYQLLWGELPSFRPELPAPAMIARCLSYKNQIVASDPLDKRECRQVLNLGHTLAHALEAAGSGLWHGEAVLWGLEFSIHLAVSKALLAADYAEKLLVRLRMTPRPPLPDISGDTLLALMKRDKKNRSDLVTIILPRKGGGVAQVEFEGKELRDCWRNMRQRKLS